MTRIAIIGEFTFPFGTAAANRIRYLAKGLMAAGAEVRVVALSQPPEAGCADTESEYDGIPYESWQVVRTLHRPLHKRLGLIRQERREVGDRLRRSITEHDIDVVLAYSKDAVKLAPLIEAARASGRPIVDDLVEWHSAFTWRGGWLNPRAISHEWCIRRLARRLDGVCGISSYICRYYERAGMPTIRVPALIWPEDSASGAAPATSRQESETTARRQGDAARLGYFGRWSRKDGFFHMLEALRGTIDRGRPVELLLGGQANDARFKRRVDKYLRRYPNVAATVRFTGYAPTFEDLRATFSSCDALLLFQEDLRNSLSRFPQKLPEYMSFGCPVIVSGVGDVPEYVRDGVDGYVVAPGDVSASVDAIVRLADLPDRGEAMGRSARARCHEVFDARAHGRLLLRFLESLTNRRERARGQ